GGVSLGSLAAFPAFDAMRQALPMVQAVILMAVTIILPLIIVFAVYEYKTVITLTFVVFALNFLTFWWELARWLDSWLLEALYGSDTHSRWNMAGFQNSTDDIIMSFVMGAMFIVLPALWMGALSWAGIKMGDAVTNATKNGSADIQKSGGKLGDRISR
ncbi:conjugal transfer protein TraG N-terminal domain-containing protein, partial [Photorhabdus aegyptia]|uniref:conjugal transfer protein TraG N-terminal domain-containing protein n=1 Tax=Photorhabdus aegyptia TaxID=2805098 RepID=UPI001E445BEC